MSGRRKNVEGLSTQEALFVEHYLACNCNGTEAARRAGYMGANDNVLKATASRLLTRVNVKAALEEQRKAIHMSATEVIQRHSEIARATFDDFLDEAGHLDLEKARERKVMHLLKEVSYKTRDTRDGPIFETRIRLYDAQAAQQTLMRYHGLLVEVLALKDLPKTEDELVTAVMHEIQRVTGKPVEPAKVKP